MSVKASKSSNISAHVVMLLLVIVAPLLSGCTNDNYNASEFFSIDAFRSIKPGMSESEVRDLIGPPLSRSAWSNELNHVYWEYTGQKKPQWSWPQYNVIFDRGSGTVVRTDKRKFSPDKNEQTGEYMRIGPHKPASHWQIKQFSLPMIQGDPPDVSETSEDAFLVQVMASWCGPCTRDRPLVKELLRSELQDLRIKLVLVSIDEDKEAIKAYIERRNVEAPVAWDKARMFASAMNNSGIPKYLLLTKGTVWPFGFAHFTGWSEEFYADLTWFVRHCYPKKAP